MNRADADALMQSGYARGRAEALAWAAERARAARDVLATSPAAAVTALATALTDESARAAELAKTYRQAAEQLLHDLSHPGVRLGRRVVLTLKAAHLAWKQSR